MGLDPRRDRDELRQRVGVQLQESALPDKLRELDVLDLVAHGSTNRDAAARLFISEATVKSHLVHIYAKLGVNDRAAAVASPSSAACSGPGNAIEVPAEQSRPYRAHHDDSTTATARHRFGRDGPLVSMCGCWRVR